MTSIAELIRKILKRWFYTTSSSHSFTKLAVLLPVYSLTVLSYNSHCFPSKECKQRDITFFCLTFTESSLPAVEILTRSAGTLPINAENPDQSHSLHSKLSQYFPDHLYNKGQISKRSDTDQSNTIDGDKSKEIQTPDSDFSSGYASDSREPDVSSATSRDSLSSVSNGAQNKKVESKTCTIL